MFLECIVVRGLTKDVDPGTCPIWQNHGDLYEKCFLLISSYLRVGSKTVLGTISDVSVC